MGPSQRSYLFVLGPFFINFMARHQAKGSWYMKRSLLLVLAILVVTPLLALSGCNSETAKEKEWEKDIPQVPAGQTGARAPAAQQ